MWVKSNTEWNCCPGKVSFVRVNLSAYGNTKTSVVGPAREPQLLKQFPSCYYFLGHNNFLLLYFHDFFVLQTSANKCCEFEVWSPTVKPKRQRLKMNQSFPYTSNERNKVATALRSTDFWFIFWLLLLFNELCFYKQWWDRIHRFSAKSYPVNIFQINLI